MSENDIPLETLVAACPSASAFSDAGKWDFIAMIDALRVNYLDGHGSSDNDLIEHLQLKIGNSASWDIRSVFNIEHDSDESCSANVLVVDGVPSLFMKRIGDQSDYSDGLSILDLEFAKRLIHTIADFYVDQRINSLAEGPISTAKELIDSSQYIIPLEGDVFTVQSPKYALGFKQVFNSHSGWIADNEGEPHRVIEFKRWVNGLRSWEGYESHQAVVLTEAGEVVVNAKDILFTLTKEPLSMQALQASARILCAVKDQEADEQTNAQREGA